MMKKSMMWKLSVLTSALLLAACGGSGNSETAVAMGSGSGSLSMASTDNTAATTTTDSTTNTATDNTTGTTTGGGTTNTTATTTDEVTVPSVKYDDTAFDKNMAFDGNFDWGGVATQQPHLRDTKHVLSGDQLDKVFIDGKEIMLMKAAQSPRINVMTEGSRSKVKDPITDEEYVLYTDAVFQSSRGGYSYTWFGVVNTNREDIKPTNQVERIDTMIAHGKLTDKDDMPATGKASYNGHAIYYANGTTNSQFDTNKSVGTTQFDVDYGAKTITGTIKDDAKKAADIALEGKISGNSFEGVKTNNINNKETAVEMKGRFFGPQAAELGGVFNSRNNDDILGAFGAKK